MKSTEHKTASYLNLKLSNTSTLVVVKNSHNPVSQDLLHLVALISLLVLLDNRTDAYQLLSFVLILIKLKSVLVIKQIA